MTMLIGFVHKGLCAVHVVLRVLTLILSYHSMHFNKVCSRRNAKLTWPVYVKAHYRKYGTLSDNDSD